jgi:hypothetical protein
VVVGPVMVGAVVVVGAVIVVGVVTGATWPTHMSAARSYPVTPLAAFALSGAFDK